MKNFLRNLMLTVWNIFMFVGAILLMATIAVVCGALMWAIEFTFGWAWNFAHWPGIGALVVFYILVMANIFSLGKQMVSKKD